MKSHRILVIQRPEFECSLCGCALSTMRCLEHVGYWTVSHTGLGSNDRCVQKGMQFLVPVEHQSYPAELDAGEIK